MICIFVEVESTDIRVNLIKEPHSYNILSYFTDFLGYFFLFLEEILLQSNHIKIRSLKIFFRYKSEDYLLAFELLKVSLIRFKTKSKDEILLYIIHYEVLILLRSQLFLRKRASMQF
jgi:hypothetical protein